MKIHNKFTATDVKHIADLAQIPITQEQEQKLADGFNVTMNVVDKLFKVETKNVEPTHQVTGLSNVFREDKIDDSRMFAQEAALKNAKKTFKGYFVVKQILEE